MIDIQWYQTWIVVGQIDAHAVDPVVPYLDQSIITKALKCDWQPLEKRVTPEMVIRGSGGWMHGTACITAVRSCS